METLEAVQRSIILRRARAKLQPKWARVIEMSLKLDAGMCFVRVPLGLGSKDARVALKLLRRALVLGMPTRARWFKCALEKDESCLFVWRRTA